MSGVQAVQARISELQGQIQALTQRTTTPTTSPAFATALQSALATGGTGSTSADAVVSQALTTGAVRPAALRDGGVAAASGAAASGTADLPGISPAVARYSDLFAAATAKHGLPPGLLAAVAQTESGGNASAVSPAGALGLMQIMPGTAKDLKVDPRDPAQAVDGAGRLLAQHLKTFGSLDLALAAYNAGPGNVRKHGGIPPFTETQNYVRKVNRLLGGGGS